MSEAALHDQHRSTSRIAPVVTDNDTENGSGDFLVITPQLENAEKALRRCFKNWKRSREGTLVLMTGPSGAGKTTIADVFLMKVEDEWHGTLSVGQRRDEAQEATEADDADEDDTDEISDLGPEGRLPRTAGVLLEGPNGIVRPIVKVFVEPRSRARGLLRDIVRALGIMPKAGATFGELMEMLQVQVAQQHVRMIMLDEVHHIVERQGSQTAYEASEVVKMLLVQARLQVVCIGLAHAAAIIDNNEELPRHIQKRMRLRPLALNLNKGSEYLKFLAALSSSLPIKANPLLSEQAMALKLHVATKGLIGQLTNLVQAATDIALDDGSSALKGHHFEEAFDDIEGTEAAEKAENEENPFRLKTVSEKAYAPIRARIEARRKQLKAQAAQYGKNHPDLTKR